MNKKSPQELISERNPLDRKRVEPLDLYSQPPATQQQTPGEQPVKSEEPKPERAAAPEVDTVKSYSTYVRESLIEGIKLRAFKRHVKDRQVVEDALEEYFKNHPL